MLRDTFDLDFANAVAWGNGYHPIDNMNSTLGFQTNAWRYSKNDKNELQAENYMMNSRLIRNDMEMGYSVRSYLDSAGLAMLSLMPSEELTNVKKISLPQSVGLENSLASVLENRRSDRTYTGDKLDFSYLATLLRAGYGITAENSVTLHNQKKRNLYLRTVSSGGGLYPFELYIAAPRIKNLSAGLYRYSPFQDCLLYENDESAIQELVSACSVPEELISLSRASAIIFLIANPWKSMRKYGERGLRFVLHEGGAISQNIHLAATSLGIGSVDCGSFYDEEIHKTFAIDGRYSMFIHAIVIGCKG